jgi:hypothetical protein
LKKVLKIHYKENQILVQLIQSSYKVGLKSNENDEKIEFEDLNKEYEKKSDSDINLIENIDSIENIEKDEEEKKKYEIYLKEEKEKKNPENIEKKNQILRETGYIVPILNH